MIDVFYVYQIQSVEMPNRTYVGFAQDLRQRMKDHNAGRNASTKNGRPWELDFYVALKEKRSALDFEAYLKTASGKAFSRKRLICEK